MGGHSNWYSPSAGSGTAQEKLATLITAVHGAHQLQVAGEHIWII